MTAPAPIVDEVLRKCAEDSGLQVIGCTYVVLEPQTEVSWMLKRYQAPEGEYYHFVIFENGEPAKAYRGDGQPFAFIRKLESIVREDK
jgi:hypothetical protein